MTGQQIYHVRRFISGATGTNTINISHVPAIHAQWEPEEEHNVTGEIEAKVEEHLLEGGVDVKVENHEVAGDADAPEPAEPVLKAAASSKSEPALQGHTEIEEVDLRSDDEVDTKAMAAAMKDAARLGVPFCEECTRARLKLKKQSAIPDTRTNNDVDAEAMAAAMKDAAKQGVPFCEECTRARLRQERSLAHQ